MTIDTGTLPKLQIHKNPNKYRGINNFVLEKEEGLIPVGNYKVIEQDIEYIISIKAITLHKENIILYAKKKVNSDEIIFSYVSKNNLPHTVTKTIVGFKDAQHIQSFNQTFFIANGILYKYIIPNQGGIFIVSIIKMLNFTDVTNIVYINQTYILASKNQILLSNDLNNIDGTKDTVITLPINTRDNIQNLTVNNNRLYIFTNETMLVYQGLSSYGNKIPITYLAGQTKIISILNGSCAVKATADSKYDVFFIGDVGDGVHTLYGASIQQIKKIQQDPTFDIHDIYDDTKETRLDSFMYLNKYYIRITGEKDRIGIIYNEQSNFLGTIGEVTIEPRYKCITNYNYFSTTYHGTYCVDTVNNTLCNADIYTKHATAFCAWKEEVSISYKIQLAYVTNRDVIIGFLSRSFTNQSSFLYEDIAILNQSYTSYDLLMPRERMMTNRGFYIVDKGKEEDATPQDILHLYSIFKDNQ